MVDTPDNGVLGGAVDHRHHHRFCSQKHAEHGGGYIGHIAHGGHEDQQRPLISGQFPVKGQAQGKHRKGHDGGSHQHRQTRTQQNADIHRGKGFQNHSRVADIEQKLDKAIACMIADQPGLGSKIADAHRQQQEHKGTHLIHSIFSPVCDINHHTRKSTGL